MNIIEAIILGAVQGITEFFPVSSSGHLFIFGKILGIESEENLIFELILHFATALALLFVMRKSFLKNMKNPVEFAKNSIWYIVATVPALIFGIILTLVGIEKIFKPELVVMNFIFVGTVFLLLKERENKSENIEKKNVLTAGIFQVIGLFPGVSRSGITTVGGVASGLSFEKSLRVSFSLFFPIVFASMGKVFLDIVTGESVKIYPVEFIAGFISAFLFGVLASSTLIKIFGKIGLKPFGVYLIIVGVLGLFFA